MTEGKLLLFSVGIAFMLGVSKSGFAGAFGGGAVPLLALAMPAPLAASLLLPVLYLIDCVGVMRYRHDFSASHLKRLLPGALIGIVAGTALFFYLDAQWIKAAIGVQAILLAIQKTHEKFCGSNDRGTLPGSAFLWSGLSGFSSMLSHAGGPPLFAYLTRTALPKGTFIGTVTYYFFVVNLIKAIPYWWLGLFQISTTVTFLAMAPAAVAGTIVGYRVQRKISQQAFDLFVIASLFFTGILLLVQLL